MKQRLTTLLTVAFLTLGTGGAIAWACGAGASAGSASFHQYKPPCDHGQGRGGDHECHGHEGEKGGGGDKGGGDKGGQGQGGGDKGHGPGGHDQGGHDGKGSHGHH